MGWLNVTVEIPVFYLLAGGLILILFYWAMLSLGVQRDQLEKEVRQLKSGQHPQDDTLGRHT